MSEITSRLSTALADRYKLERHLGEGGMATVYLAEDLKHKRKVAVKVLRPELAAVLGAERFVQEITTTANLQHPHILPLHDSGDADGFLYYVMPFIDGETLRDKLNRETQLGIEEAVRITTEVADALDYAHQQGVIHRDIKPENILLQKGRPMVADFGIALAVSAAAGGRMTETGLSLGTPHYMSPEQATAEKDITPRSDVYSLGCVLYEMLAGDPPHVGPTAQSIVMRILTEEPRPVHDVRKSVPPHVAAAVSRVLEKLPADRFESASDFAKALQDSSFVHVATGGAGRTEEETPKRAASSNRALLGVAALAALAVGAAAWGWLRSPDIPTSPPVRLTLEYPEVPPGLLFQTAVSPDGRLFAVGNQEGIYVRRADQTGFQLLPGTDGAFQPVFSPDGEWVAYHKGGDLLKMAVDGSAPLKLVSGDNVTVRDPLWGEGGTIVFSAREGGIYRVPDTGGKPEPMGSGIIGRYPHLLPDGSGVIITVGPSLEIFDFESQSMSTIVDEGTRGTYVETGHVIYGHPEGGLFAVAFDLGSHKVTGNPTPVLTEVWVAGVNAFYSVSRNGTLVYPFGTFGSGGQQSRLLLLTNGGDVDTLPLAPRAFAYLRFSPDGRHLVFNTGAGRTLERTVHTYDLVLGTTTQLSFEGGGHSPVWSPDGTRVVYSARVEGSDAEDLYIKAVDGSTSATHVAALPRDQHALDWPTDDVIAFSSGGDLWTVDLSVADAQATPYLQGEWPEGDLAVSPSGTLAAYRSDETGRSEVFVRRFPVPEGQWRISESGGRRPQWAPDGETLYYQTAVGDTIVAVTVPTDPPITPRSRRVVAVIPRMGRWDVDPSSGRIVVVQASGAGTATVERPRLLVVVNFFEELKAKVGN